VHGDSPDTVHGKETGFHGVFGETATRLPDPGTLYRWDIANRGRRLDGEGERNFPPPLSLACHRERFSWMVTPPLFHRVTENLSRWITPHLPAAPRPPPAPSRGGGQCMAIVRIPCYGGKQDSSVNLSPGIG